MLTIMTMTLNIVKTISLAGAALITFMTIGLVLSITI
jgi:hypothetical protein